MPLIRLLMPVEHVTGWLFRVARNRITDLFRKRRPEGLGALAETEEDGELLRWEEILPAPDAGPEALYARGVLLDELRLRRSGRRERGAGGSVTGFHRPRKTG